MDFENDTFRRNNIGIVLFIIQVDLSIMPCELFFKKS